MCVEVTRKLRSRESGPCSAPAGYATGRAGAGPPSPVPSARTGSGKSSRASSRRVVASLLIATNQPRHQIVSHNHHDRPSLATRNTAPPSPPAPTALRHEAMVKILTPFESRSTAVARPARIATAQVSRAQSGHARVDPTSPRCSCRTKPHQVLSARNRDPGQKQRPPWTGTPAGVRATRGRGPTPTLPARPYQPG